MSTPQQAAIESCIERFRAGALTESDLRDTLQSLANGDGRRQELLYVQAGTASVKSDVNGMFIARDGEIDEGPPDPDDMPYATVLDAVQDGWRIIKFPELAVMLDETRLHGPGVEFILERLR
jgi:hypothetical protein